eukprot:m.1608631 g.1608631  ORF g.1608631 m.1608631 type:complete len:141 (-) comp25364_c0_seq5:4740-5162(-)
MDRTVKCVGDTHVCICVCKKVVHTWVMSMGPKGEMIFWESLTGEKWVHPRAVAGARVRLPHAFCTIGCVFNHESFFANIQPSDFLDECSVDLNKPALWKAMSRDAIASLTQASVGVQDEAEHSDPIENKNNCSPNSRMNQ